MKKTMFQSRLRGREGASLVVAMLYVTAIVFVTVSLATISKATYENIIRHRNMSFAKNLALSLLEYAEYLSNKHEPGWEPTQTSNDSIHELLNRISQEACEGGEKCLTIKTSFTIESLPKKTFETDLGDFFIIPFPREVKAGDRTLIFGTGNAGTNCADGRPVSQEGTATEITVTLGLRSMEHPCHWNRITLKELIEIPLYYEKEDPVSKESTIVNSPFERFILRVRTPCKEGWKEGQTNCLNRVLLQPYMNDTGELDVNKDKTIIKWEITGKSKRDGTILSLLARPAQKRNQEGEFERDREKNTELYASRINYHQLLSQNVVLDQNAFGVFGGGTPQKISDFLKGGIEKPILRLEMVSRPQDRDEADPYKTSELGRLYHHDLPYLEYQILTDQPIADFKRRIEAEVEVDNARRVMEAFIPTKITLGGFSSEGF